MYSHVKQGNIKEMCLVRSVKGGEVLGNFLSQFFLPLRVDFVEGSAASKE